MSNFNFYLPFEEENFPGYNFHLGFDFPEEVPSLLTPPQMDTQSNDNDNNNKQEPPKNNNLCPHCHHLLTIPQEKSNQQEQEQEEEQEEKEDPETPKKMTEEEFRREAARRGIHINFIIKKGKRGKGRFPNRQDVAIRVNNKTFRSYKSALAGKYK